MKKVISGAHTEKKGISIVWLRLPVLLVLLLDHYFTVLLIEDKSYILTFFCLKILDSGLYWELKSTWIRNCQATSFKEGLLFRRVSNDYLARSTQIWFVDLLINWWIKRFSRRWYCLISKKHGLKTV